MQGKKRTDIPAREELIVFTHVGHLRRKAGQKLAEAAAQAGLLWVETQ